MSTVDLGSEFNAGPCTDYIDILEGYIEGTLDRVTLSETVLHLRSCAGCQGAVSDAVAANEWLHRAERPSDPGPAFARNVMARIRIEQLDVQRERASFWEPMISLGWKFATTAAVVLMVMLTYVSHNDISSSDDVASVTTEIDDMTNMFVPGQSSVPELRWQLVVPTAEENGGR